MLRRSVIAGILAFSALAVGCTTYNEPTSQSNFDPSVNFAAYKTYRLFEDPLISIHEDRPSQLVVETVDKSVEATLSAKGYVRVFEDAEADFAVGFTVGVIRSIDTISLPVNYEDALRGDWAVLHFEERKVIEREGVLDIHVFDVATKRAAYSTTGAKRLPANYDRNDVSQIPSAVNTLLSDFPPE